ncbi:choice-of-anchor I family protein [Herbiconiux sp. L3-i23]|uniref:choice-of-anchor I family protein n=1 Tax=Herbiconiux sp. L3-i23 TaxID=2905871 RepID=UPI002047F4B5|nr:choice-of-anchor I family protein [Herbiconiux sp. L3-i23]BDI22786.1 alkaline phosphatase [Herbiconiux sp. L3-i23]
MRLPRPLLPLGAAAAACTVALLAPFSASAAIVAAPIVYSADDAALSLAPMGSFDSGEFGESAAEIVEYYPAAKRLFVVNALQGAAQVLSLANPAAPTDEALITVGGIVDTDGVAIPVGASVNSVSVRADGLVALAVQSDVKTDAGWVVFLDGDSLSALGAIRVGALPDMVTFTPDGTHVLVAGEGEPSDDYTIDPLGTIGIIATPAGKTLPAGPATVADFTAFEGALPPGVRVFGPNVEADFYEARNLEPEYIAVSADSSTAWATLQEANALATIDIATGTITEITALGTKDWSDPAIAGLDPSNDDSGIAIANWPVFGLYQPDAIASYSAGTGDYLVTANEGDAREWGNYAEDERVADVALCPGFPNWTTADGTVLTPAELQDDANLGRLNISTASGFNAADGCFEELYSHGARSFSIWDANGALVFDSGSDFEEITAAAVPDFFNATNDENNFDNRSDDKGPEPEGVAVGEVDGRTYAFIGFERVGGVAVYDITDPAAPSFTTYVNNRDFSIDDVEADLALTGDLGPEGLAFIPAVESPTGAPLLAVGNEVSGTTTLFGITALTSGGGTTPVVDGPVETLPDTGFDGDLAGAVAGLVVLAGAAAFVGARRSAARV